MHQDEIIWQNEVLEMARQVGYQHPDAVGQCEDFAYFDLEAFAKLVAAKEREACAKVCEDIFYAPEPEGCGGDEYYYTKPYLHCAEAIRARGEA